MLSHARPLRLEDFVSEAEAALADDAADPAEPGAG